MKMSMETQMNINIDCIDNIQVILGSIREKIHQCQSLSEVLNYVESTKTLPHNWPQTVEQEIIMLYLDLLEICKNNNIL